MLENSSSHSVQAQEPRRQWGKIIAQPLWVLFGFGSAVLIVGEIVRFLQGAGISVAQLNPILLQTLAAAATYLVTLLIVIGGPRLLKYSVTTSELGVRKLPSLGDLSLAPVAFALYLIGSTLLGYVAQQLIPGFDSTQAQDTGFTRLTESYQYILAFITLVVMAPFAEELLFRGYLYGKLRRYAPVAVSMVTTSLLFGVVHGQWNVGVDVFVLSLALTGLREMTGSIWAGVVVHMLKNGLAFYLLFINPVFLHTIGG
jgi:membrane protease YdiL (CAAX protease family)